MVVWRRQLSSSPMLFASWSFLLDHEVFAKLLVHIEARDVVGRHALWNLGFEWLYSSSEATGTSTQHTLALLLGAMFQQANSGPYVQHRRGCFCSRSARALFGASS